jgi:hypothetical protein
MSTTAARKGKMVEPVQAEEALVEETIEQEVDEEVIDEVDDDFGDFEDNLSVEDMADDEELFPNGPVGREVKAWKKQYGEIYVTSFDEDVHIIWRTMNRFEYRRIVKNLEQAVASGAVSQAEANLNNEESICEMCVLWPKMLRTETAAHLAGMATVIAQEVMEASAFVPLEVRKL